MQTYFTVINIGTTELSNKMSHGQLYILTHTTKEHLV
jgi:hypothetical protein